MLFRKVTGFPVLFDSTEHSRSWNVSTNINFDNLLSLSEYLARGKNKKEAITETNYTFGRLTVPTLPVGVLRWKKYTTIHLNVLKVI